MVFRAQGSSRMLSFFTRLARRPFTIASEGDALGARRKMPSADDDAKAEKRHDSDHVDEEAGAATEQDDQAEETFWWGFFDRKDALENRLEEWKNDESTDLATRKEQQAALQEQLNGMNRLARQDSVDPVPKELARLKRWYRRATIEQRKPWADGLGPNLPFKPDVSARLLEDMQEAYDKLYRPSKRAVAEQLGIDRRSRAFKDAWDMLHQK